MGLVEQSSLAFSFRFSLRLFVTHHVYSAVLVNESLIPSSNWLCVDSCRSVLHNVYCTFYSSTINHMVEKDHLNITVAQPSDVFCKQLQIISCTGAGMKINRIRNTITQSLNEMTFVVHLIHGFHLI